MGYLLVHPDDNNFNNLYGIKMQGNSSITPIKEAQIYGVVKTRLLQRKYATWIRKIHVYDIFSGDGLNIVDGNLVWGSPVEIVNAIIDSGIPQIKQITFTASDIRKESVDILQRRIGATNGFLTNCKHINASAQLTDIKEILMRYPSDHAIIIVDPNGPGVLPFNELLHLSRIYNKRIDILLNISETAMTRILGCHITKDKNWWADFENFCDIVNEIFINYKQAWVRQVVQGDRQRWRFLCFWSYAKTKQGWKNQGLHAIETQEALNKLLGETND